MGTAPEILLMCSGKQLLRTTLQAEYQMQGSHNPKWCGRFSLGVHWRWWWSWGFQAGVLLHHWLHPLGSREGVLCCHRQHSFDFHSLPQQQPLQSRAVERAIGKGPAVIYWIGQQPLVGYHGHDLASVGVTGLCSSDAATC